MVPDCPDKRGLSVSCPDTLLSESLPPTRSSETSLTSQLCLQLGTRSLVLPVISSPQPHGQRSSRHRSMHSEARRSQHRHKTSHHSRNKRHYSARRSRERHANESSSTAKDRHHRRRRSPTASSYSSSSWESGSSSTRSSSLSSDSSSRSRSRRSSHHRHYHTHRHHDQLPCKLRDDIRRLPQDKLQSLLEELELFVSLHLTGTSCTKRQLLSLVGKLAFACKVVPAGRIFLRRLLDLAHSHSTMDSLIHISDEALQDALWWKKFASSWNGVAFFLDPTWTPASELQLYTDASGTLGFGGYWNGAWFSQPWPPHLAAKPIEWKELYAVVIACEVWGSRWSGKRILFHCDNLAIVRIWESELSRCSDLITSCELSPS